MLISTLLIFVQNIPNHASQGDLKHNARKTPKVQEYQK